MHAGTREAEGQIRLYVADAHPMCIAGIASQVSRHEEIVLAGSALTWDEAAREVADIGPDVAMIGDTIAGSCTAALGTLNPLDPTPKVVFLADSVETASVYEAMAMGAAGYLTRDVGPEVVVEALRDVCDGRTALTPALQTLLAEEIRLRAIGADMVVSTREQRILQLIADGMPTTQIADALRISRATVKSDVSSILVKLGVHDRAAAVAAGMRRGLIA